MRAQRVRAREIDELRLLAIKGQGTDVSFYSYAGIIADALFKTRQPIE